MDIRTGPIELAELETWLLAEVAEGISEPHVQVPELVTSA